MQENQINMNEQIDNHLTLSNPKKMNDMYGTRPTINKVKVPLFLYIKDVEVRPSMPPYHYFCDFKNKKNMIPKDCNTSFNNFNHTERRPNPNEMENDESDDEEDCDNIQKTSYKKYKNMLSMYEYCKATQFYPETPSNMVIVINCISKENYSCTLYVHGFRPYFYVRLDDSYDEMNVKQLYNFMIDNFCDWCDKLDRKAKKAAISYEIVQKKKAFGWESDYKRDLKTGDIVMDHNTRKKHTYIKFYFCNQRILNDWKCILSKKYRDQLRDESKKKHYQEIFNRMKYIKKMDKTSGFDVNETKVSNEIKFFGMLKTSYCSWIKIDKIYECTRFFDYSQVELNANIEDIHPIETMNYIPRIVSNSFDTEWTCKDTEFTNVYNPNDGIICLTNNIEWMFEPEDEPKTQPLNIAFCVGQFQYKHDFSKDPLDKQNQRYVVKCFNNELDCIDQWMREMTECIGVDWFTTYNGDGFDWKYILTRARWLSHPKYVRHFYTSYYERKIQTHKNLSQVLLEKGDQSRYRENYEKYVMHDLFLSFLNQTFETFGDDIKLMSNKCKWISKMNEFMYQWEQIVENETNLDIIKTSFRDTLYKARKNDREWLIKNSKTFLALKLKQFLNHYIPSHEYQNKHRKLKSSLDTKKYFFERNVSQRNKQRTTSDGKTIHKKKTTVNGSNTKKQILSKQTQENINVHDDTITLCDYSGNFINSYIEPSSKIMTTAGQDMEMFRPSCPSRVNFDMYRYMRMEKRFQSYSLNSVAKEILKDEKVEMPYELMFRNYDGEKGLMNWTETLGLRNYILEYGFKDSILPQDLLKKLKIIQETFVFAKTSYTKPDSIWARGQQIKIWNYSVYQCQMDNFVIDRDPYDNDMDEYDLDDSDASYKGARVLDPIHANYDDLVSTLDYKSLYPSIMRAYNLCISTFMSESEALKMSPDEYFKIKTEDDEVHYFKKTNDTVYPKIFLNLGKLRTEVKDQMENCDEASLEYQLCDKKQLAIKKLMNSFYGALAAKFGMISEKSISQCVTAMGREIIDQTVFQSKKIFKEKFHELPSIIQKTVKKITIIYGDSVTGSMPSMFYYQNKIIVDSVYSVSKYIITNHKLKWVFHPFTHKYTINCSHLGIKIWSQSGWTPLCLIIRHTIDLNKKRLYRVKTRDSIVEVTEDHSLLNSVGQKITPSCMIQESDPTILMCNPIQINQLETFKPSFENIQKSIKNIKDRHCAIEWLIGFCMSCVHVGGIYFEHNKNEKYIEIHHRRDVLDNVYIMFKKASNDKLIFLTQHSANENRKLRVTHKKKDENNIVLKLLIFICMYRKIPETIFQRNREACENFWMGYMYKRIVSPDFNHNETIEIHSIGAILYQQLSLIFNTLGYKNIHVQQSKYSTNIYNMIIHLNDTKRMHRLNSLVENITDITDEYKEKSKGCNIVDVFDFETENHTFQCGIGSIIVHNTDSIMLCYNGLKFSWENIKAASEASEIISDGINDYWKSILKQKVLILENEKTCRNFLLMGKKHYLAWSYEPKHINNRIESKVKTTKGLDIIKRGTLSIASHYGYKMINSYFGTDNPEYGCLMACIACMRKLFENRYDIKDLIMSKTLKASYEKSKTKPPHANVADKIRKRTPGQEPKTGERVYYVYLSQDYIRSDKVSDRAEDVSYALENQLPLDIPYYIDICFKKFKSILEALYENVDVLEKFIQEKKKKLSHTKTKTMIINNSGSLNYIVQSQKNVDITKYMRSKRFTNGTRLIENKDEDVTENKMTQNSDHFDSEWSEIAKKLVLRKKNKSFVPHKMKKVARKNELDSKLQRDVLFCKVKLFAKPNQ